MNSYRYPGTPPFGVSESSIFFGRNSEAFEFFNRVRAQRIAVLYASSGTGKTSLLNAGVFPLLMKAGYWPIPVKFEKVLSSYRDTDVEPDTNPIPLSDPLAICRYWLKQAFQQAYANLPSIERPTPPVQYNQNERTLWDDVKSRPFPGAAVPVFVFDQFEDFFAYSDLHRTEFLRQLAELLHEQAPARIAGWIALNDNPTESEIAWARQPEVRAVFSIRYDRLGDLDNCKPFLPLITRNRYHLEPLRVGTLDKPGTAEQAIEGPALIEGSFQTPPYTYQPLVMSRLLNELQDEKMEVDATHLQIVCQTLEEQLQFRLESQPSRQAIDDDLVPDGDRVKRIISEFYQRKLKELVDPDDITLASRTLENFFVLKGKRIGIDELPLRDQLGSRADVIINHLVNVRLIRPQATSRNTTAYELSHDKLVKPVEDAKQERLAAEERQLFLQQQEEKRNQELAQAAEEKRAFLATQLQQEEQLRRVNKEKRRLRIMLAGLILLALALIYQIYRNYEEKQYSNRISVYANKGLAAQIYDAGKHDLAYRLWEEADSAGLQSLHRLFAPFSGEAVLFNEANRQAASLARDNTLRVFEQLNDSVYQPKGDELVIKPPRAFRMAGHYLYLIEKNSLLTVFDIEKPILTPITQINFPRGAYFAGPLRNIKYSANGKFLLLRSSRNSIVLYRLDSARIVENSFISKLTQLHQVSEKEGERPYKFNPDTYYSNLLAYRLSFLGNGSHMVFAPYEGNLFYLVDLMSNKPPKQFKEARYLGTSESGRKIIFSQKEKNAYRLKVYDVKSNQLQLASQLITNTNFNTISFLLNERNILLERKKESGGNQLFLASLAGPNQNEPIKLLASSETNFVWIRKTNQVVFWAKEKKRGPSQAYLYNFGAAATHKKLLLNPTLKQIVDNSSRYLLIKSTIPQRFVLYDLETGQLDSSAVLSIKKQSNNELRDSVLLYESPDLKTVKLIMLSQDRISMIDLFRNGKSLVGQNTLRIDDEIPSQNQRFSGLTLEGQFMTVSLLDGGVMSFFVDNFKNRPLYLSKHIYPPLSDSAKQNLGISR